MKANRHFFDAIRQATKLVRARGPMAATRFIQQLLGESQANPKARSRTTQTNQARDSQTTAQANRTQDSETTGLPEESGQFLNKRYSGTVGARDFKLYLPSSYDGKPLPLVIMLHGCTQDPDDFALGTRANRWAESKPCLMAYPKQVQRANAHRCWNWFNPSDQRAGAGEPAIIAGIVKKIAAEYAVDAQRVYVAGLSAGGAMAAVMGEAYPDLFAAVGVHSGLPAGAAQSVSSALSVMKTGRSAMSPSTFFGNASKPAAGSRVVPVIVFHGDADQTVNPDNGAKIVEDALEAQRLSDGKSSLQPKVQTAEANANQYGYRLTSYPNAQGVDTIQHWEIRDAGHTWVGGNASGTYADARGPDAMRAMLDFFAQHVVPKEKPVADVIDSAVPS